MSEKKESWGKKVKRGNRLYWLLAAIGFPVVAALVAPFFAVGCRCVYGSARAAAYDPVICILWARLGIGFALGENKKKIWIYLVMPIVLGIVILIIGNIMGIEG